MQSSGELSSLPPPHIQRHTLKCFQWLHLILQAWVLIACPRSGFWLKWYIEVWLRNMHCRLILRLLFVKLKLGPPLKSDWMLNIHSYSYCSQYTCPTKDWTIPICVNYVKEPLCALKTTLKLQPDKRSTHTGCSDGCRSNTKLTPPL